MIGDFEDIENYGYYMWKNYLKTAYVIFFVNFFIYFFYYLTVYLIINQKNFNIIKFLINANDILSNDNFK